MGCEMPLALVRQVGLQALVSVCGQAPRTCIAGRIIMAFSRNSGAPQPGAFICVMGDRHIFRINRCGALQPAAAACSSCEPG